MSYTSSYASDYVQGKETDNSEALISAGISTLTAGILKTAPKVPGRMPNFGTKAFLGGAHTIRSASEELFSNSVNTFASSLNTYVGSNSRNLNNSQTNKIIQLQQSLISVLQSYIALTNSIKYGK